MRAVLRNWSSSCVSGLLAVLVLSAGLSPHTLAMAGPAPARAGE